MNNNKLTTGSNYYKNQTMFAVSFDNDTCPMCGHRLRVVKMYNQSTDVAVRYQCDKCNFICPIQHYGKDLDKIKPMYDSSIFRFVQNFGQV